MRTILATLSLACLAACSPGTQGQIDTALTTVPGRLFCAIQTGGGGAIIVGLVNAGVTGVAATAAPLAVVATGATKAYVDDACARAGTGGIPVSPPPNPAAAPVVAVVMPRPEALNGAR